MSGRRMAASAAVAGAKWLGTELALDAAAPVINPVVDARDLARSAHGAARSFWIGSRGLRAMHGRRGRDTSPASARVGGEWFHGAGDRHGALGQIGADFTAFENDLAQHATSDDDRAWVAASVAPTLDQWHTFVAKEQASALAPWVTEWSVFENWWERLRRLRELARARGIALASADPVPLPKTLWQRADTGTGSSVDVWISALKTVILGSMALVGAASLYSIVRDFSKRAPKALDVAVSERDA